MRYHCKACGGELTMEVPIFFCPFCGASLATGEAPAGAAQGITRGLSSLENSLYVLQGHKGEVIHEIGWYLNDDVDTAESDAKRAVEVVTPEERTVEFGGLYDTLLRCESREALFRKLERAMQRIRRMLNTDEQNAQALLADCQLDPTAHITRMRELDAQLRTCFAAVGAAWPEVPVVPVEMTLAVRTVPWEDDTRAALLRLCALADELFETFRKVVTTNTLYAAFPWTDGSDREGLPFPRKKQARTPEQAVADAEEQARHPYIPDPLMLDDSGEKHVEGFWAALEALCRFTVEPVSFYGVVDGAEVEPEAYFCTQVEQHYEQIRRAVDTVLVALRDRSETENQERLRALRKLH